MNLRTSSIPLMTEYISNSGGDLEASRVGIILSHEDYRFEAKRYGLASVEHLVFYFSHLKNIELGEIPDLCDDRKNALRDKHFLWLDCASCPQKYYDRYEKLKAVLCEENLKNL